MQTSPSTLPATRITKRSLNPWPKSISVGTRASEQPITTANGDCLGISPYVRGIPISRPLHGTTYCGSPWVSVRVRQLSIHCENNRLPSSRHPTRSLRIWREGFGSRILGIESIDVINCIHADLLRRRDVSGCQSLRAGIRAALRKCLIPSLPFVAPGVARAQRSPCLRGCGPLFLEAAQEAQEPVENRQGMGRISRNIQIDRQEAVDAVVDLGMTAEDATGNGARADGDHDLGRRARPRRSSAAPASCSR